MRYTNSHGRALSSVLHDKVPTADFSYRSGWSVGKQPLQPRSWAITRARPLSRPTWVVHIFASLHGIVGEAWSYLGILYGRLGRCGFIRLTRTSWRMRFHEPYTGDLGGAVSSALHGRLGGCGFNGLTRSWRLRFYLPYTFGRCGFPFPTQSWTLRFSLPWTPPHSWMLRFTPTPPDPLHSWTLRSPPPPPWTPYTELEL